MKLRRHTVRAESGLARQESGLLIEVDELRVAFTIGGVSYQALNGVSFTVGEGESIGIVGESGSGKTLTAKAILGLLDPRSIAGGVVRYRGTDLVARGERAWRRIRGREVTLVPQNALAALNPLFPVGWQIAELFRVHEGASRAEARRSAVAAMERVGIPAAERRYKNYPHEFSGGMRQRVMIAMAIALRPRLLIADEPTTALDVTIESEVMELLDELRRDVGMAVIHITHDLGLAASHADRLLVMYAGRIVEEGPVSLVYDRAAHPYTRALLDARPALGHDVHDILPSIPGVPPKITAIPGGCPFHPRCRFARPECAAELPLPRVVEGRSVACHFAEDVVGDAGTGSLVTVRGDGR